jgi:hypothetical protein
MISLCAKTAVSLCTRSSSHLVLAEIRFATGTPLGAFAVIPCFAGERS